MSEHEQNGFQRGIEALKEVQGRINQSWFGRSIDWISHNFGATIRQGAKELAQILPAFPDSVRPVEELGTIGNPTQLEVNREKGNVHGDTMQGKEEMFQRDRGYEEWLESRAAEAAARKPQDNGISMER